MKIQKYLEKNKSIYDAFYIFLENESSEEDDFQNLVDIVAEYKICENKHELILFLHLIAKTSENYRYGQNVIFKFEKILHNYENDIKNNLSNSEIFNIFKNNKRILLFLVDEKIINIDQSIAKTFITEKYFNAKYPQYFAPEIKQFIKEKWFPKYRQSSRKNKPPINEWVKKLEEEELTEDFYRLRKDGQNEGYICKLIRNDSIDDFIVYINRNNISLLSTIVPSIYETNSFLIEKQNNELTLIEYAAFFGSYQILKYLQLNNVDFEPQLLIFAIHGRNAEIIHLLETMPILHKSYLIETNNNEAENNKQNEYKCSYEDCLNESIKCHYNDVANYFLDNFFQINFIKSNYFCKQSLKYYNFSFIQSEPIGRNSFYWICKYEYYMLIKLLLEDENFDVNRILKKSFQLYLKANLYNGI